MRTQWAITPLGELCDILDSKRKPITKKVRTSGEFPYYGATGILDYVEDYIFDEKLVLIGEDGAKWGAGENTAFSAEGKYWVNNHAHVIRPHRDTRSRFATCPEPNSLRRVYFPLSWDNHYIYSDSIKNN